MVKPTSRQVLISNVQRNYLFTNSKLWHLLHFQPILDVYGCFLCTFYIKKKKKKNCLERLRATFCCYFKDSPSGKIHGCLVLFSEKKARSDRTCQIFPFPWKRSCLREPCFVRPSATFVFWLLRNVAHCYHSCLRGFSCKFIIYCRLMNYFPGDHAAFLIYMVSPH